MINDNLKNMGEDFHKANFDIEMDYSRLWERCNVDDNENKSALNKIELIMQSLHLNEALISYLSTIEQSTPKMCDPLIAEALKTFYSVSKQAIAIEYPLFKDIENVSKQRTRLAKEFNLF